MPEQGSQIRQCAVNKLINEGVDPKKTSSELAIRNAADHRKSGTCKYTGCHRAMHSADLCHYHQPIKAEKRKSDRCQGCGQLIRGSEERGKGWSLQCMQQKARGNSGAQKGIGGKENGTRRMLGLYNILDRYSRYLRTSTYARKKDPS